MVFVGTGLRFVSLLQTGVKLGLMAVRKRLLKLLTMKQAPRQALTWQCACTMCPRLKLTWPGVGSLSEHMDLFPESMTFDLQTWTFLGAPTSLNLIAH